MAGPLSSGKIQTRIDLSSVHISIVVAEWNEDITEALYSSAVTSLIQHGVQKQNIIRKNVPGTFELSLGAQWMAQRDEIDAVICLGCVYGNTPTSITSVKRLPTALPGRTETGKP